MSSLFHHCLYRYSLMAPYYLVNMIIIHIESVLHPWGRRSISNMKPRTLRERGASRWACLVRQKELVSPSVHSGIKLGGAAAAFLLCPLRQATSASKNLSTTDHKHQPVPSSQCSVSSPGLHPKHLSWCCGEHLELQRSVFGSYMQDKYPIHCTIALAPILHF